MDSNKFILRPSGISGFFDCQYRWFRDNLYKPIRSVGFAAHFGTSLHKAGETFYNECIAKQDWLAYNSSYSDIAVETLNNIIKDDEPSDLKSIDISKAKTSLDGLAKLYTTKAKDLNYSKLPLAVEKHYTVKIDDTFSIAGTLDIVGKDYIADIKTMNKNKAASTYVVQQATYALLREMNKEEVKDLFIHKVITPKNDIQLDNALHKAENVIPIEQAKDRVKVYIETIYKKVKAYQALGDESMFIGNPTSMLCSEKYCAYFKECKYRKV